VFSQGPALHTDRSEQAFRCLPAIDSQESIAASGSCVASAPTGWANEVER
jgi:hypothetical protein